LQAQLASLFFKPAARCTQRTIRFDDPLELPSMIELGYGFIVMTEEDQKDLIRRPEGAAGRRQPPRGGSDAPGTDDFLTEN